MNVCRICLSKEISKSLKDIETVDLSGPKNYIQVLMFCFGIEVSENSTITKGLCMKCFTKITSYYKFKTLALSSDAYLWSLEPQIIIKNEVLIADDDDVFNKNDSNDKLNEDNIKNEVEIQQENSNFDSDDDVLSDIKKCKDDIPKDSKKILLKDEKPGKTVKRDKTKNNDKKKYPKTVRGVCEECGKFYKNLTQHARTHVPKQNRVKIKCDSCDREFTNKRAKQRHIQTKHKGIKQSCDICNKEVTCLRTHKLYIHQREKMQFSCTICNQRCCTAKLLESHMMMHTQDRPFECDVCQANFRLKSLMTRHKRQVHDKERSHMCQLCSKTFFKKDHLLRHLRTHTDERPYTCEECGDRFRSSTNLKNHRTIHSDDRPYPCPHCDKKFSRYNNMSVHIKTHSDEKKHPCKYCGVSFRRPEHRKQHEYTQHEKNIQIEPTTNTGDVCNVTPETV